jgi:hypothetical protein
MATLVVFRPKTKYRDRARRYKIMLDGTEIARVRHGDSVRVDVAAGSHGVAAKIDWATSPTSTFDIAESETVALRCTTGSGPALVALLRSKKYLSLERVDPSEAPPQV